MIILILYHETPDTIRYLQFQRKYLKKCGFKYYFITCRNQEKECVEVDDMLYIKGEESIIPGILNKTIISMKYLNDKYHPSLFFRTNITTVINKSRLEVYLSTIKEKIEGSLLYAGKLHELTWIDPPSGIIDDRYKNTVFASGTCILISRDLSLLLIHQYLTNQFIDVNITDDVSLGVQVSFISSLRPVAYMRLGKCFEINNINVDERELRKDLLLGLCRIKDNPFINSCVMLYYMDLFQ